MNLEALDLVARDYIGIFIGGIAYYALGALWYTVLFGKRWIAATGRTMEEFPKSSPAWMGLTLVAAVVSTAVVAVLYQWGSGDGVVDGLIAGMIVGAGVAAMEMLKDVVYNFDSR
ncbi:MAG: DUF1761 domain-containing protein, partial [Chloroflexi bacterium]|nr:DUF1761 domain-containing protein [Chloroflexota bacterium]